MRLAAGILFVAFVVSIIYGGALKGDADKKIRRFFLAVAAALAIAAAVIFMRSPSIPDNDDTERPKTCNGVQC